VTADMTLAEIVDAIGLLLQQKFDRDGSEVSDADTNTRAGAAWPNAVDDWLMALQTAVDDLKSMAAADFAVKDTRNAGDVTTASIASLATGNFTIVMPSDRVAVQWLRVVSNSSQSGPTGRLQFFADAARTKQVYDSLLRMGDPPVDVDDFVDGMAWGAFADDSSGLESDTLYGSVTNGGGSASTFTVKVVAISF
jgi:hypothetical protein